MSPQYDLPAELTLMILLSFETPSDLYVFIRVYKPAYQLFRDRRITILQAVLTKAIPQENHEAFFRLYAAHQIVDKSTSRYYRTWDAEGARKSYAELSLVERYEASARRMQDVRRYFYWTLPEYKDRRPSEAACISSCKIWRIVDYFVRDYAAWALANLRKVMVIDGDDANIMTEDFLSKQEYARIFATFCQFEEYRLLFGGLDNDGIGMPVGQLVEEQEFWGSLVFGHEAAALHSVYAYLRTRVSQVIHASLALTHSTWPTPCDLCVSTPFFIELGLPFLKELFTDRLPRRKSALIFLARYIRDSPGDAPRFTTMQDVLVWNNFHVYSQAQHDDRVHTLESPNYRRFPQLQEARRVDCLLDWLGVVFWDEERLKEEEANVLNAEFDTTIESTVTHGASIGEKNDQYANIVGADADECTLEEMVGLLESLEY